MSKERMRELEQTLHFCRVAKLSMDSIEKYTDQLKQENKRFREALEFYADEKTYDSRAGLKIFRDSGRIAKKALGKK